MEKLPALVDDLIQKENFSLRQLGLLLAKGLPAEKHFSLLEKLGRDGHPEVREAVADGTRGFTTRITKTVKGKRYSFLSPAQPPQAFALLREMAMDESPT